MIFFGDFLGRGEDMVEVMEVVALEIGRLLL